MAIVELSKLSVIGLNDRKTQILKGLMDLGVVEINNQDGKLTDENWSSFIEKDGDEVVVYGLDTKISEASNALDALNKYDKGKKPFIKVRKPLKESEFEAKLKNRDAIEETVAEVNGIYKDITRLKNEESKINTAIIGLRPWVQYDLPLDMTGTRFTSIFIGTVPAVTVVEDVERAVSEKSDGAVVYKVSSDEHQSYLSVVCFNEEKNDVLEVLRQNNFTPIAFNEVSGKANENIVRFEKELEEIRKNILSLEEQLSQMASNKPDVEILHDNFIIERDKAKILSSIVKTKTAFYFDGWLPKAKEEEVKGILEQNGCFYDFKQPQKDEEKPILLEQNSIMEPFEAITNLYSVPSVKDIDPTPFLAPFYFIFFGMMLSDAGYGIIMAVACFILLNRFRLEGMMKKLVKMFMYCGISTTFWGVMFGGYFGDFIPVVAKTLFHKDMVINALWFNPIDEPMTLLIFSLILGAIHLFVGMGIKGYMLIKDGRPVDALCDIFLWYVLLIGLVLFGIGGRVGTGLVTAGKYMSIVGVLGILFTAGREKKGIVGKLLGGLGSLYGITSYLSDILSYSRLLALGLATGVISQVINTLGSMAGGGVAGAIVMVVAFVIGHTFNIGINALGSFVHASRLQYVEFFGKFFEGGGSAFNPFNKKTKYVEIIKEEK
ncbi:MAG TPA: V-type ATP synthase subunit I [Lachnospiraceae bacterium]|nr:V-type ATP synthase subunit I [Lachnospiraceae bacterium]